MGDRAVGLTGTFTVVIIATDSSLGTNQVVYSLLISISEPLVVLDQRPQNLQQSTELGLKTEDEDLLSSTSAKSVQTADTSNAPDSELHLFQFVHLCDYLEKHGLSAVLNRVKSQQAAIEQI